jgi:Rrf2 family iron-sulfur cluster assembly transcriptional regulator
MKITAQEEYGLRILLTIARNSDPEGITISQISEVEGLSVHNVAKLARVLRLAGLIKSNRGQVGGYTLTKPADQIYLNKVLEGLGGKMFEMDFCEDHTGLMTICTNSSDCSLRSFWQIIQNSVDQVLQKFTLQDLLGPESDVTAPEVEKVNVEFRN